MSCRQENLDQKLWNKSKSVEYKIRPVCVCVCESVLSSCLSVPEATVLLIAKIDELYSQGSLSLWLHMKAG